MGYLSVNDGLHTHTVTHTHTHLFPYSAKINSVRQEGGQFHHTGHRTASGTFTHTHTHTHKHTPLGQGKSAFLTAARTCPEYGHTPSPPRRADRQVGETRSTWLEPERGRQHHQKSPRTVLQSRREEGKATRDTREHSSQGSSPGRHQR
jgi:hypothetical protein